MDQKRVFLLPGELCATREPTAMATLLGSCVAVCLFNRVGGFGGMNHYMLPAPPVGETPSTKHGDYSTELLIKMMLAEDAATAHLEALVLGGGNVNGHLNVGAGIGANNIIMARNMLEKYQIPIVGKNIGGDYGRKIFYENWTGAIQVKRIEKSAETKVLEEKKKDYAGRRIKVLVVDDSQTVRDIIINAVSDDPQIEVVGQAANPYEARELLLEHDPDVICLDVIMPKMDGITFLKKLFLYKPKPVIIISTVVQKDSKLRQQAKSIGAVEVIDKEELQLYSNPGLVKTMLVGKIKTAAAVWVRKKTKEELDNI